MTKLLMGRVLLLGAVTMTLIVGPLSADDMPEDILIENEGYATDRKGPVSFSHLSHSEDYGVECRECHHIYEDGENVWDESDEVQKCRECHIPTENRGKVKKLKIAFHRKCKNCHRKLTKEGMSDDAPYRKCSDCHEKKR